jgi:hypothetical protein
MSEPTYPAMQISRSILANTKADEKLISEYAVCVDTISGLPKLIETVHLALEVACTSLPGKSRHPLAVAARSALRQAGYDINGNKCGTVRAIHRIGATNEPRNVH